MIESVIQVRASISARACPDEKSFSGVFMHAELRTLCTGGRADRSRYRRRDTGLFCRQADRRKRGNRSRSAQTAPRERQGGDFGQRNPVHHRRKRSIGPTPKRSFSSKFSDVCERHVYDRPPPIDGQPPRSDRIDRPRSVGWLATIGGSEHGGGRFGSFGERTVLLSDDRRHRNVRAEYAAGRLSQRNVFVQLTATTDHQVDNPGAWIYFVKLIGAAQSYTQCMNFEVSSDGAPIGDGAVPILSGASTTFDTSASASQSRGRHKSGSGSAAISKAANSRSSPCS